MPSASTTSEVASSMATESSLLLRARPVSVALKNSRVMDGAVAGMGTKPEGPTGLGSVVGIVPRIDRRKLHRLLEGTRFGGAGHTRKRRGGCALCRSRGHAGGDRQQVARNRLAIGITHLGPLLQRECDDVRQGFRPPRTQGAHIGCRLVGD